MYNKRVSLLNNISQLYTILLNPVSMAGTMKFELIRDHFVVGIRDIGLSEHLQAEKKLTLNKAKKAIRIKEAVHEQQELLQGDTKGNPISLDGVWANRDILAKKQSASFRISSLSRKQRTRCDKVHDRKAKCLACDTTCHRCCRKGHAMNHSASQKQCQQLHWKTRQQKNLLKKTQHSQQSSHKTDVILIVSHLPSNSHGQL